MTTMNHAVTITAYEQAEYFEVEHCGLPAADEVAGETVVSLISPGSELAGCFFGSPPFPKFPGYAAVMIVTDVGAQVDSVQPGDYVFFPGYHRRYQKAKAGSVLSLPTQLDPSVAVIARLMGVSMTTLMTTTARPGERVLIMGAGPVGYLAAHMFQESGYRVSVSDPDPQRRELLASTGIRSVLEQVRSHDGQESEKDEGFALAIDCSGHETAVLEACRAVRKGGEVVMVGVPWKPRTDHKAHELLHAIFHNYVHLRSGWEWEIPHHASDFRPHSITGNWRTALDWLSEGKIPVDGLIRSFRPQEAQTAYRSLADRKIDEIFVAFDWRS